METDSYCQTLCTVTLRRNRDGMPSGRTLAAGSIVRWEPGPDTDQIQVFHGTQHATLTMDDAAPVEWDAHDEQWITA